jgi:hypothetical protein
VGDSGAHFCRACVLPERDFQTLIKTLKEKMLQLNLLFMILDLLVLIACPALFCLANFANIQNQKKVLLWQIY